MTDASSTRDWRDRSSVSVRVRAAKTGSDLNSLRPHPLLLVPALALFVAAGCGGDGDGGSTSDAQAVQQDIELKDQAAAKAKQAANKVVQATPDKNLPGPKRYLAVCQRRGDPDTAGDIPPNVIKCHIEAFYKDYRGEPGGYIWSEDWHVPIENGKLGAPVIAGAYRIQNFLREDHKRNCTGRHRPRECLPQSVGGILPG